MRPNAFRLLAAVAVVLVAAGGASAAELTNAQELAPEDESEDGEVGICVVGADSPCNGEETDGEQITNNDSDDNEMWIPEDQDRDGQIDERFGGEDEADEDGQMWIPEDQNRDGEIDERFRGGNDGEKVSDGNESDETNQIWLPEDQNRDGQIDDRFLGHPAESLAALVSGIFGLF